MSENKRKLDDTEAAEIAKRSKTESDSEGNGTIFEDLNFLKSSITQEITKHFEKKFISLENEIKSLKEEVSILKSSSVNVVKSIDTKSKDEEPEKVEENDEEEDEDDDDDDDDDAHDVSPTQVINKEPPKATFGANSIQIKNSFITPTNSFRDPPTVPNTQDTTPKLTSKPVFGATTSFGKSIMDNLKSKPSVFDTLPSKSESPNNDTKATSITSSFGSNSKFGNAFQNSLSKKSFLDQPAENNDESETKSVSVQQFKQVDLEPIKNVTTGEEDEISHFSSTAKIFELDFTKISEGWKERGVGPLHLNQSKADNAKVRLVMRSQGLLRVVLNHRIQPNTELLKGLEASLTPGKFLRLNSIREDGTPIQYLLKFSNQALRDSLIEKVEELKRDYIV